MTGLVVLAGAAAGLAGLVALGSLGAAPPAGSAVSARGTADATPAAATPAANPFAVVQIVGRDYAPKGITIDVGTTVYWVNEDGNAHTATAFDGAFDSGNLSRGAIFAFTFAAPGRYDYGCDYHLDMGGSVTVME